MLDQFLGSLLHMAPLRVWDNQVPFGLGPTTNPVVVPPSTTGGGLATVTVELPGDCYIRADDWRGSWEGASATYPTDSNVVVQIYWGNREWVLFSNPIPLELLFGTAQRPGRFGLQPWLLAKPGGGRGVLTFEFTNLNTVTNTTRFVIMGARTKTLN